MSLLAIADGGVGFFYHVRGVAAATGRNEEAALQRHVRAADFRAAALRGVRHDRAARESDAAGALSKPDETSTADRERLPDRSANRRAAAAARAARILPRLQHARAAKLSGTPRRAKSCASASRKSRRFASSRLTKRASWNSLCEHVLPQDDRDARASHSGFAVHRRAPS